MIITSLILFQSKVFAQKGYTDKINQINDKQKNGLWVDTIHNRLQEIYYKNGIESGIFKQYNLKGRLLILGEYCNGKMCGKWYFFENTGHLWFVFKDFAKNTDPVVNEENGKKYVPDYKCYSVSYYPSGGIRDEGVVLWNEGDTPESDFSVEYGEWKYYDEKGNLTKIKVFK